jgi:hypothetical protein
MKNEAEKLTKKNEELDNKYREQLKKNLDLSKELTVTNEELIKVSQKAETLETENKKHKRLAKIIVTT